MAKLPGAPDLGGLPTPASTRPVGTYDVGPYAAGAQKMAQATVALGKGVGELGAGGADYAIDKNRWEYAQAHTDFLANKIDLDNATSKDTNYGPDPDTGKTLPERYQAQLKDKQDTAAARISDPRMRARFEFETKPLFEQGVANIKSHATALENNANVAYTQQQGDNLINKAVATPDDDTREQLIKSHNQLVDGLVAKGAVTHVQAVAMKREWAQQYATADYLAAINSNDPTRTQAAVNRLQAAPGSGDQITNRILQVEGEGKNKASSAQGAGQFIDSTWLDMVKRHRPDLAAGRSDQEILALRADRNLGRDMTGAYREENEAYLKNRGLPTTPGAQYLAHFLGPGAAAAVLQADPKTPVADALRKAMGDKAAAAAINANPSILGGQLAGSVTAWADSKMGGGDHYELLHLRPDVRERLIGEGEAQLHKQATQTIASFHNAVQDDLAEANNTGTVAKPKTLTDFIGAYGSEHGPPQFANYQADLQAANDKRMLVSMPEGQMRALISDFAPKSDAQGNAGYAAGVKRQLHLAQAAANLLKERDDDPAGYGVKYLPAVQESWKALQDTVNDATATPDVKARMARDYATKQVMEQQRLGIAKDDIRIAPQSYIDDIGNSLSAAASSDEPGKRVALIGQVKREAAMWGDQWPAVMRQMADKSQPIVRAIAAGADEGAMTRLLSLPKNETAKTIIGEQNDAKLNDVTREVNSALADFRGSLVGRQLDRDYPGYAGLATTLAALHVRDGQSARDAATTAFNELIGNRYDFRDTYRIPKSAAVDADLVQSGALSARYQLARLGVQPPANDLPGRTAASVADDMRVLGRDGRWVTAPDNSGLNLVTPGGNFARGADGQPFVLPWGRLADIGRGAGIMRAQGDVAP